MNIRDHRIGICALQLLAALLLGASGDENTARWLRIRSPELYGHLIIIGDRTINSTAALAGADPQRDGLWISVDTSDAKPEFVPPLTSPPKLELISLPPGVSAKWKLVPLQPGAAGLSSLRDAAMIHISRRGDSSFRASLSAPLGSIAPPCRASSSPSPFHLPQRIVDFEGGPLEPLHNRFNVFNGRGAEVHTRRQRDANGSRLAITSSLGNGFGGVWIELAPSAWLSDADHGVDGSELQAIVVRGRGDARGVSIKLSDVAASKKDEGVLVGKLGSSGPEWEERIALANAASKLDLKRLRTLVLDLTGSNAHALEIDEILFTGASPAPPPYHPAAAALPKLARGTWIWNTNELLESDAEITRLLATIKEWQLSETYLQLPHRRGDRTASEWTARAAQLAPLIARLHAAGVTVHALDGAPYLALAEARNELTETARSVNTWNAKQAVASRFDALHLDIEPYLLPGFGTPKRTTILESLTASLATVKSAIGTLPLWIDVPFWYDATEAETVERGERAGCARLDFLRAVLRSVDGLGIMAYRTVPDGADGIAAHSLGEIELAHSLHRSVRVGIETISLPAEDGWEVSMSKGVLRAGMPAAYLAPDESYLLFNPSPTAGDLASIARAGNRFQPLSVTFVAGAASTKVTFFGKSGGEIRSAVEEAVALLARAAAAPDGVAFHESRTLPH